MGTQLPFPKGVQPPNFQPCLWCPNGWMNQDAAWYGGRPRPRPHCVRWGASSPSPNGAQPPIFGPRLLWRKGWMDQDATWQRGRPRPRQHCVRWRPSSPSLKGHSPQFLAHVCCGQTAGWIKIPLGMEVGLVPGHNVLDGDPAQPPQRGTAPNFWPVFVVAKRLDGSRCHLVGR